MAILGLASLDIPLWDMPQINFSQRSFGSGSNLLASTWSARLSNSVGTSGSFSFLFIQARLSNTAGLTTGVDVIGAVTILVVVVVVLVVLVVLVAVLVLVVVVVVLVAGGGGLDLGGDGIPAMVTQT